MLQLTIRPILKIDIDTVGSTQSITIYIAPLQDAYSEAFNKIWSSLDNPSDAT